MAYYVVAHLQKFKAHDLTGMEKHLDHTAINSKNKDIKRDLTHLNYDILDIRNSDGCNLREKVIAKIESRSNNSAKLRKDAVVMCSVVVSASPDFFKQKTPEQIQSYFESATESLDKQFGAKNHVAAIVHMDEDTPHMHYVFCPMTHDNKLCCKDIVNRNTLRTLQDVLPHDLQARGFDVERGVKDSPRWRIDTNQWKHDELIMQATKEKLLQIVNNIEATSMLGKKVLSEENYNNLKQIAQQSAFLIQNNSELQRDKYVVAKEKKAIESLKNELEAQEKEIIAAMRKQQEEATALLARQRQLSDRERQVENYRKIVEAQDKDVQLQKLLDDAIADKKFLEQRAKELDARQQELERDAAAAVQRVHDAAKRAVLQELEQQTKENKSYWEKKAMLELARRYPDEMKRIIQRLKMNSAKEKANEISKSLEKERARCK